MNTNAYIDGLGFKLRYPRPIHLVKVGRGKAGMMNMIKKRLVDRFFPHDNFLSSRCKMNWQD